MAAFQGVIVEIETNADGRKDGRIERSDNRGRIKFVNEDGTLELQMAVSFSEIATPFPRATNVQPIPKSAASTDAKIAESVVSSFVPAGQGVIVEIESNIDGRKDGRIKRSDNGGRIKFVNEDSSLQLQMTVSFLEVAAPFPRATNVVEIRSTAESVAGTSHPTTNS